MNDPNEPYRFKLTVSLHPSFLSSAYSVERYLSRLEALTFLQMIRPGVQNPGDPDVDPPEHYLEHLRQDSRECFSIRDGKFCFELACSSAQEVEDTGAKEKPLCPECGSDNVSADAAVCWNIESQDWEVTNVFDKGRTCEDCESTDLDLWWVPL